MPAPGPAALGRAVIVGPGARGAGGVGGRRAGRGRRRGAGRSGRRRRCAARGVEHPHAGRDRAGRRSGAFRAPASLTDAALAARGRLRAVGRPPPLPRVGQQLRRPGRRRADLVVGAARRPASAPPRAATADVAAPRRHAGLDRRRAPRAARRRRSTARRSCTASRSSSVGSARSRRRSAPSAVLAPDQLAAVAPRRRTRADHRPGRVGQDPRAHRALPPPARRPRLRARGRRRPRLQQEGPGGDGRRGCPASAPASRRSTRGATASSARALGRRPELLDEREVRSIVERLVPTQAAPREHRPDRAVPRRALADPPRPARPAGGGGRARRRHRAGRGLRALPRGAAATRRHRLRRAGLRRRSRRSCATASCGGPCRPTTATCSSTSSRTSRPPTSSSCAWPPARPPTCSASGDDDQCIYGHVGADPRFLVDYAAYFPGARRARARGELPLPGPGHRGGGHAARLQRRPGRQGDPARARRRRPTPARSRCRRTPPTPAPGRWSRRCRAGSPSPASTPAEVAVLTRVQSLLLAPARRAGRGRRAGRLDPRRERAVAASACGPPWPTCASPSTPTTSSGADLSEVHRRPSRGLPQWATKWLDRCRSIERRPRCRRPHRRPEGRARSSTTSPPTSTGWLASARGGATARDLLTAVRDDIGLGSAMTLLDSSGGASGSHLDDLEALLQVADLHPDAGSFEAWLRRTFHRERAEGGVTLSTIHRVKGREWDRVVVFGATEGLMPHRLADDVEEERRILHVGITRGRAARPRARRPHPPQPVPRRARRQRAARARSRAAVAAAAAGGRRHPQGAAGAHHAPGRGGPAGQGARRLRGRCRGHRGHRRAPAARRRRLVLRPLRRAGHLRRHAAHAGPPAVTAGRRPPAALRAWRLERSKADGVPAFVVLSDKHLDGIAERHPTSLAELRACPGIGPAKLETYGDEILEVLAGAIGLAERHRPVGHAEPGGVDQQDRRHDADRDAAPPPRLRAGRREPACTSSGSSARLGRRATGSARRRRRAPAPDRPPSPTPPAPRRSAPPPPPHGTARHRRRSLGSLRCVGRGVL